jgi:hypothetical protein
MTTSLKKFHAIRFMMKIQINLLAKQKRHAGEQKLYSTLVRRLIYK